MAVVFLCYFWRRRQRVKTTPIEIGPSEERKAEFPPDHPPAELAAMEEPRSPQELAGDELALPGRGIS